MAIHCVCIELLIILFGLRPRFANANGPLHTWGLFSNRLGVLVCPESCSFAPQRTRQNTNSKFRSLSGEAFVVESKARQRLLAYLGFITSERLGAYPVVMLIKARARLTSWGRH